jgi:hypothetical protein
MPGSPFFWSESIQEHCGAHSIISLSQGRTSLMWSNKYVCLCMLPEIYTISWLRGYYGTYMALLIMGCAFTSLPLWIWLHTLMLIGQDTVSLLLASVCFSATVWLYGLIVANTRCLGLVWRPNIMRLQIASPTHVGYANFFRSSITHLLVRLWFILIMSLPCT